MEVGRTEEGTGGTSAMGGQEGVTEEATGGRAGVTGGSEATSATGGREGVMGGSKATSLTGGREGVTGGSEATSATGGQEGDARGPWVTEGVIIRIPTHTTLHTCRITLSGILGEPGRRETCSSTLLSLAWSPPPFANEPMPETRLV